MAIEIQQPQGDLAKTITHEPKHDWPTVIEIVARWKVKGGGRGKTKRVVITGEEFFGISTGAPMTGDQLIATIDRLRKSPNGRA